ncbi:MAG: hypothetical protein WKF48_06355 [Solirubrobacteraceae bacterium]
MHPRWTTLLTAVALASAAGGCGADDDLSTDIPRTSPDLTIPTATTEIDSADTTTDTTSTTDTTTGTPPSTVTPPAAPPPAATTPPAPAPPVSTTGGAGAPSAPQSTTGGAQADPEFQNFCRDNPGAPPPC